jgi:hypothetical protein
VKTAGRVLLLGWVVLALGVVLIFAFPKPASSVLHPIASYFQLIPAILLVATAVYSLIRIYRMGSARDPVPPEAGLPADVRYSLT